MQVPLATICRTLHNLSSFEWGCHLMTAVCNYHSSIARVPSLASEHICILTNSSLARGVYQRNWHTACHLSRTLTE